MEHNSVNQKTIANSSDINYVEGYKCMEIHIFFLYELGNYSCGF